jgi:hypothetical protein
MSFAGKVNSRIDIRSSTVNRKISPNGVAFTIPMAVSSPTYRSDLPPTRNSSDGVLGKKWWTRWAGSADQQGLSTFFPRAIRPEGVQECAQTTFDDMPPSK